jgi:hypothetical protein
MQLDLFLDSRAVMLANDVGRALTERDAERAQAALCRLRCEAPDHPGIGALERVTTALAEWSVPEREAAAVERCADWISGELASAAREALREGADELVAASFRELASVARDLPFDPVHPRAHLAWLSLQCGDWEGAEAACASIPQAEEHAEVIEWRAVARYRRYGLSAARPHLYALAWHAPSRLASVIAELGDELLLRDWRRFERASEWEAVDPTQLAAWFPAWYVLEHPVVGAELDLVAAPAGAAVEAAHLLRELIELEKRGSSQRLGRARARLRELNADLFSLYMERRETRYL